MVKIISDTPTEPTAILPGFWPFGSDKEVVLFAVPSMLSPRLSNKVYVTSEAKPHKCWAMTILLHDSICFSDVYNYQTVNNLTI